jgi:hypothetical protein
VSSSDGGITWTATFTRLRASPRHQPVTLDNTGSPTPPATPAAAPPLEQLRHRQPASDGDHRGCRPGPDHRQTSLVTITFSEAVTGFDNRPDSRQRHLEP